MLQLGLDLIYLPANGFTVSTLVSSVDFRTNVVHTDKETRRKPSSTTACRQRARQPKLDLFGEQYRFMQRLHGLSWPHWPAGASPQSAQNDNWAIRNRRDAVVLAWLVLLPNIPSRHTHTHTQTDGFNRKQITILWRERQFGCTNKQANERRGQVYKFMHTRQHLEGCRHDEATTYRRHPNGLQRQ